MPLKLSNILGVPFRPFIIQQLKTRALRGASGERTLDETLYLGNQMAWVRLCSSVKVDQGYLNHLKDQFGTYGDSDAFLPEWTSEGLAKNWILQSGTSKITTYTNNTPADITLREGVGTDGVYGLGGIRTQGYRPMPGITSVNVESAGRLGSLRYANIEFKVWNRNQLDIIDALYLRLGYTMLLEWGHVQYFQNGKTDLETDTNGIDGWFNQDVTKEGIQYEINKKVAETQGNYDGMLGVVCNFNYSFNEEGGWDCSIKLIGLGSIMESQKINSNYTMPPSILTVLEQSQKKIDEARKRQLEAERQQKVDEAYKQYEDQYNKDKEAFEKANPVRDLVTFYNSLVPAADGIQDPGEITADSTKLDTLMRTAVMTPHIGISKVSTDQGGGSLSVVDTQEIGNFNVNTTPEYPIGFYSETRKELYPTWIQGGLGGSQSGFIYPLVAGNTYKANITDIPQSYRNAGNLTSGDYDEYVNASQNALLAYLFATALPKSSPTKTAAQLKYTFEADEINFQRSFETVVNGSSKYIQEAGDWVFQVQIKFNEPDLDRIRRTYANTLVVFNVADILNSLATDISTKAPTWTLKKTDIQNLSRQAVTPGNGRQDLKYVTVVIEQDIVANNLQAYNSVGGGKIGNGTESIRAKLQITTDIPSILTELVTATNIKPGPPVQKSRAEIESGFDAVTVDSNQENKSTGLASAIEALLNVVKYKTIAEYGARADAIYQQDIVDITGRFFNEVSASSPLPPMSPLYVNNSGSYTLNITANQDINLVSTYPPIANLQEEELLKNPLSLGIKGYCTALMQDYNNGNEIVKTLTPRQRYERTPSVNFKDLHKAYLLRKYILNSSGDTSTIYSEYPVYITLGYLLYFINNQALLYDTTKNSGITGFGGNLARPVIYIDYNPETNMCFTMPSQASVDPSICLIPYEGNKTSYESLFINNIKPTPTLFDPDNRDSNLISDATGATPIPRYKNETAYQGKVMNILLNIDYLLNVIETTVDRDNHNNVYLQAFLERLVSDINKSTGDINAFRVAYNDMANTVGIYDDQYVPSLKEEESLLEAPQDKILERGNPADILNMKAGDYFEIPVFEQYSLAREFTMQTDTSTRMSRAIAIGAQAANNGSVQSVDSSTYHWLNKGLVDRVIEVKNNSSEPKPSTNTTATNAKNNKIDKDPNLVVAEKFDRHMLNIYGNPAISDNQNIYKETIAVARNFMIQSATKVKATDSGSYGTLAIPLNAQLTLSGISGIMMGNAFLLPDRILPISIRGTATESKFGFYVMGLRHELQSNEWVTSIKGQIVKLRKAKPVAPPASPTSGRVTPPQTSAANVAATSLASYSDRLRILWEKASKLGLNKAAVAGIAGTTYRESGLNYQAWIYGITQPGGATITYAGSARGDVLDTQTGVFQRPTYRGSRITAYGISQWVDKRLDRYVVLAQAQGDSYETQVDYLLQELQTSTYSRALNGLKAVSETKQGAADAALVWLDYYEFLQPFITDPNERNKRVSAALGAYEQILKF